MDRREAIKWLSMGPAAGLLTGHVTRAVADPVADKSLPPLKIRDVRAILTAPAGIRLVVVKVETTDPDIHGLGCATFTQRPLAVATAVEKYLKPFLVGKNVDRIEDTWQSSFVSSYWRNGPVLNNAISGVDMALWDIKGKRANMPVYQLFGGKVREAADLYAHAGGADLKQAEDSVRAWMEKGYRHVRCQVAVPGYAAYGSGSGKHVDVRPIHKGGHTFEPAPYARLVPKVFEHLRTTVGDEVELLHDVHERVPPIMAIDLAKRLEPYRLFFLEDPFSPEDVGYFKHMRTQTTTPIAMGELFNNPNEFVPLIADRLIDFIRVHLSQIGGLSMGRKLAALCEFFHVRTAWHGPGDVSPVGHAANLHLDLACYNFGIQEQTIFNQATQDVFPGCPEIRDGYMWLNEKPGLGMDCNEELAKKFPFTDKASFDMWWGDLRRRDGTIVRP